MFLERYVPEVTEATTNYILRAEYEARHNNLEARVVKIEADLNAVRTDINMKIDKVIDRLDTLRDDVYKYRDSSLKMALGWLISFLIGGGGLFGLLELLHVLK